MIHTHALTELTMVVGWLLPTSCEIRGSWSQLAGITPTAKSFDTCRKDRGGRVE